MSTYREAGVDLGAAEQAVSLIRGVAAAASRPEVVEGVGGFAGLFRIGDGKLLAAATDGVGTKLEVARMSGRLDTVGIDLVAMCADDVVCTGAEPLFFLDYLAVGRVRPDEVASILQGVAAGCRLAGCALLGGETAEHPGVMAPDRFDLAGFCVGVVAEEERLGPHRVRQTDVLVGLASTGLHSNGYSLVRRVLLESGRYGLDQEPQDLGRPLVDELLEPTAIYAPLVAELAGERLVHAVAHVTGGGIGENVPRALPEGAGAELDAASWPEPPIFGLLRRAGGIAPEEMFRTFNLGLGMVLVVPPECAEDVLSRSARHGTPAHVVGKVTQRPGLLLRHPGEA